MAYAFERGYGRGEKPVTGMGWGAIPAKYGTRLARQSSLRGFPCGPGRTAAPGARSVGVTDYVAGQTTEQLGVAPLIVASAAKTVASAFHAPSARYAGGPLISTVNSLLQRIAAGDASALQAANTARLSAKDKAAWQKLWDNEIRAALTPAMYSVYVSLDPSKAGGSAPSVAITPASQGVVGPASSTTGGGVSPVISDIVRAFAESPIGQQIVARYGGEVVNAVADQKKAQVGAFVGQNLLPIAAGAGLLLFLAMRK